MAAADDERQADGGCQSRTGQTEEGANGSSSDALGGEDPNAIRDREVGVGRGAVSKFAAGDDHTQDRHEQQHLDGHRDRLPLSRVCGEGLDRGVPGTTCVRVEEHRMHAGERQGDGEKTPRQSRGTELEPLRAERARHGTASWLEVSWRKTSSSSATSATLSKMGIARSAAIWPTR